VAGTSACLLLTTAAAATTGSHFSTGLWHSQVDWVRQALGSQAALVEDAKSRVQRVGLDCGWVTLSQSGHVFEIAVEV
jgi:hypothetical protein